MQKIVTEEEREKYLSIGEAAEYLDISVDTLRRWEKKDRVTAYRSEGGHRYFDESDLEKLVGKRYTRTVEDETRERKKADKEDEEETLDEEIDLEEEEEEEDIVEETIIQAQEVQEVRRKVIIPPNVPIRILQNPRSMRDLSTKVSFSTFSSMKTDKKVGQSILDPIFDKKKEKEKTKRKVFKLGKKEKKESKKRKKENKKKKKKRGLERNNKKRSLRKKMKGWSKMQKIAVWAVAVFILIDVVLFFIWYSIPKLLSPIP